MAALADQRHDPEGAGRSESESGWSRPIVLRDSVARDYPDDHWNCEDEKVASGNELESSIGIEHHGASRDRVFGGRRRSHEAACLAFLVSFLFVVWYLLNRTS